MRMNHMDGTGKRGILFLSFVLCAGLVTCASAAGGIQTSLGDVVALSGYSPSSPSVYMFLTGPNLPANGVALDNINRRADQGGFTVVNVDGNDQWTYKWNTANVGGRLDEGSYMIWVVNGPNDLSRLGQAEYSTIMVTLGSPSITAGVSSGATPSVSAAPATLDIITEPAGASVVLSEKYMGMTPLTTGNLTPGTYTLSLSKFGYTKITTPVRLDAGKTTTVNVPLILQVGSLAVNSTPPGSVIQLDGSPAGISPALLSNLSAGSHQLTVSHDGYIPVQEPVTVVADQVSPVSVNLTPVASATLPLPAAALLPLPICAIGIAVLLGIWSRNRSR